MKKTQLLGEFQEIVLLAILFLDDNAYGVSLANEISTRLQRKISRGSLHTALTRLETKGLVRSKMGGATAIRGGRRKRFYHVTNKGKAALHRTKSLRDGLWNAIPKINLDLT